MLRRSICGSVILRKSSSACENAVPTLIARREGSNKTARAREGDYRWTQFFSSFNEVDSRSESSPPRSEWSSLALSIGCVSPSVETNLVSTSVPNGSTEDSSAVQSNWPATTSLEIELPGGMLLRVSSETDRSGPLAEARRGSFATEPDEMKGD